MTKTAAEIRETFLAYFEERGHRRVKSSSLVPLTDPTLLFTNAGMNQFKEVFLGLDQRSYDRAVSSQKCMRVSGKHNDLETVGRTARHHTFFEMLGNFSFGDYFKQGAIDFAWELCTDVFGLPADQLCVSIFEEDQEAFEIWNHRIGIPSALVYRLGASENFWSMGDTGPCGPCSEIHFDYGRSPAGHEDCGPDCECGRYLEVWNLVFMQFDKDARGHMTPLPSPSIDTGLGLERISALLQGVESNYDTDLFGPLIEEAGRLLNLAYGESEAGDVSLRILADHSRACAFLINDGVVPGNEGRGYVLRKILRRAIRHGRMQGRVEPFLFTLTVLAADLMKDAYPELERSRDYASRIVRNEEEKFSTTLTHGLERLDGLFDAARRKQLKKLAGVDLFRLYDTFGFPLDLAREIAAENGFSVDEEGFQAELAKQRQRARASWKGAEKTLSPLYARLARNGLSTQFTGYDQLSEVTGRVLALVRKDRQRRQLREGEEGELVLDRSPFYAESGGQVGDRGVLENDRVHGTVVNTVSPVAGLRIHMIRLTQGTLRVGDQVVSSVFGDERADTARNHTATHLMHAALRDVLGEHVRQAGSLVAPQRLRFDFTHYQAVSPRELQLIEEQVNEKIRENIELKIEARDLDEAIRDGAMALFGEKYQDRVRVVQVPGYSMELCGGTHVKRTGDIALFTIVSENGISAGVRRIEAITAGTAFERFLEHRRCLEQVADRLKVSPNQLLGAASRLTGEVKQAQRELERLQLKLARRESGNARSRAREVAGVQVLTQRTENLDRPGLRSLADELRTSLQSGVVLVGSADRGKVSLVAMVSRDLTDRVRADRLIRQIAPLVGGGGGGRAEMAEAGGRNVSRLDEALETTYKVVADSLSSAPERMP